MAATPLPALTDADLAQMFELAPVSLWLEDFSGLKDLFERWRAEGVTDLRSWLLADRARLRECTRRLLVLAVNQRTAITCRSYQLESLRWLNAMMSPERIRGRACA